MSIHKGRQRGFSLIELAVVLAIMSLVAMAMTPNIANVINEKRAQTTAQETQAILDAARSYRHELGSWPGGATCSTAITALSGTSPPMLAGITGTNKYNNTITTSCTANTFSVDQVIADDWDQTIANTLPGTTVVNASTFQIRSAIGIPGSEPALDAKLSRVATGNIELNRMRTQLLMGNNNISEVNNISTVSLNASGGVVANTLESTGQTLVRGQLATVGPSQLFGEVAAFSGVAIEKVVVDGSPCSRTGLVGRTAAGALLSCQGGTFQNAFETPDIRVASCMCTTSGCACNPTCPAGYTLINRAFSGIDSNSHRRNRMHTGLCAR